MAPQRWHVVDVEVHRDLAEAVASFLLDRGAPGLESLDDERTTTLRAHFSGEAPRDALRRFLDNLADVSPRAAGARTRWSAVADSDWAESWKQHFPPLAIGSKLFVHPPWIRDHPSGRLAIEIDPGMAFGTGHHASTHLCLKALDELAGTRSIERALDLGTGSGILAIAAAKLGSQEVVAVDVDATARAVAARNLATNHVAARVSVQAQLSDAPCAAYDLILANLYGRILIEYGPRIAGLLNPGAAVVGAGITEEESPEVRAAWRAGGLVEIAERRRDGWAAVVCEKPARTR